MATIEIKHRITGMVLYMADAETMKAACEKAIAGGAKLWGANLWGSNLYGADLRGADLRRATLYEANLWRADLRGADLRGADLGGADLRGADLRRADLGGADLFGADLGGAKINWQSHGLISELLWRGSDGNGAREQLAAWIGRKTEWCWEDWLHIEHPDREWALSELAKWVTPDDGAPAVIHRLAGKAAQQAAPVTVG